MPYPPSVLGSPARGKRLQEGWGRIGGQKSGEFVQKIPSNGYKNCTKLFWLPLRAVPAAGKGKKMGNILVVSGDPIEREARALVIELTGHECATAASLEQAVSLLRKNPFDLVITDSDLPDADCDQIVRRLKSACPSVAVMALCESPETIRGADARVDIPCSPKELQEGIDQVLGGGLTDQQPSPGSKISPHHVLRQDGAAQAQAYQTHRPLRRRT